MPCIDHRDEDTAAIESQIAIRERSKRPQKEAGSDHQQQRQRDLDNHKAPADARRAAAREPATLLVQGINRIGTSRAQRRNRSKEHRGQ